MLDLDLLRTFVALSQTRSVAAAGALLDCGRGTVKARIGRLEAALGNALFRRSGRRLAPTRHGEVLLEYANRILALSDEGVRALTASGLSGEVRLGVTEQFFPQYLPEVIACFARAHPELSIAVRTGLTAQLRRMQHEGALDLVIGLRAPGEREGKTMFREPLCWVARRGFPLERDAPVPLIALPAPCIHRAAAIEALRQAGRSWRERYAATGILGVQAAVAGGLGVACLPLSTVLTSMSVLGAPEALPALADSEVVVFPGERAIDDRVGRLLEVIRVGLPRLTAEVMSKGLAVAA